MRMMFFFCVIRVLDELTPENCANFCPDFYLAHGGFNERAEMKFMAARVQVFVKLLVLWTIKVDWWHKR